MCCSQSVIAPRHSANLAMPLWRLPPGRTNLPAALSLFVYYMHYIDPPVVHGSSAIESQILAVEALQRRGVRPPPPSPPVSPVSPLARSLHPLSVAP